MRPVIIALISTLALAAMAPAAQRNTIKLNLRDGTTVVMSSSKDMPVGPTKFVLRGDARLKVFDKTESTTMTAQAETITAVLFASAEEQKAAGAESMVKSVELAGSPRITYTGPKVVTDEKTGKKLGEVRVTTEATADIATYNGVQGIAYLVGHVKITRDDPSLFAEPATATGDKASINLRHASGSGNFDFKIESDPSTSQIEVVPKAE